MIAIAVAWGQEMWVNSFKRVALLLCGLLCAAPAPAGAQPEVRVIVVSVQPPATTELAGLVWSARMTIREMEALANADVAGALSSGGDDPIDADGARGLLAQGRQAFADLELDRAASSVQRAGALLVAAGEAGDGAKAFALLAQVQRARKDDAGVREAFSLLLHVSPDFELDAGSVPPSVRRAFEETRERSREADDVKLRIDASPVPAAVSLDGRLLGVTPALLHGVPPGAHVLAVEADGFRRDVRVVRVKGGAVRRQLEPARRAALLDQAMKNMPAQVERDATGPALRDLRSLFFADQAILIELHGRDVTAHLYDLKVGLRVRRVVRQLETPRETGREVVEALYRGLDPRAPGLTAPEIETPEEVGRPYHERWWFWPAVGVGVAAAVAIPLAVLADSGDDGLSRHDGEGALVLRF